MPNRIATTVQQHHREAAAGAVGAGAAQGAYQVGGYAPKWISRARTGHNLKRSDLNAINEGTRPKPRLMDPKFLDKDLKFSNKRNPANMEDARKEHMRASSTEHVGQIKSLWHKPRETGTNWAHYYRNLPKEMNLPLHTAQKVTGYTHTGRLGEATGLAVTAAGAGAAALAVHHHYNMQKNAAPTADDYFGFEEVSKKKTDWNQLHPIHGAVLGAAIGHPVGGTIGAIHGHKQGEQYRGRAFEHEVAANNYHVLNTLTPEAKNEFHTANAAKEAEHLRAAKTYHAASLGKELEGFHTGSRVGALAGAGVGAAAIAVHHHYHIKKSHPAPEMPH